MSELLRPWDQSGKQLTQKKSHNGPAQEGTVGLHTKKNSAQQLLDWMYDQHDVEVDRSQTNQNTKTPAHNMLLT